MRSILLHMTVLKVKCKQTAKWRNCPCKSPAVYNTYVHTNIVLSIWLHNGPVKSRCYRSSVVSVLTGWSSTAGRREDRWDGHSPGPEISLSPGRSPPPSPWDGRRWPAPTASTLWSTHTHTQNGALTLDTTGQNWRRTAFLASLLQPIPQCTCFIITKTIVNWEAQFRLLVDSLRSPIAKPPESLEQFMQTFKVCIPPYSTIIYSVWRLYVLYQYLCTALHIDRGDEHLGERRV